MGRDSRAYLDIWKDNLNFKGLNALMEILFQKLNH